MSDRGADLTEVSQIPGGPFVQLPLGLGIARVKLCPENFSDQVVVAVGTGTPVDHAQE
jgi:hypothetical protein